MASREGRSLLCKNFCILRTCAVFLGVAFMQCSFLLAAALLTSLWYTFCGLPFSILMSFSTGGWVLM